MIACSFYFTNQSPIALLQGPLLTQHLRWSMQRHRWQFAKQSAVLDREPSELPEAMVCRNSSDGRTGSLCPQECAPCQMHPSQPEIADRPHAIVLLATSAKRSLRCANGSADLGQVYRLVLLGFQKALESIDHPGMLQAAEPPLDWCICAQARDHGMHKLLLQGVRNTWIRESAW